MLVEPAPIQPPSRPSRARLLATLAVPPVVLAIVVGAALVGAPPDTGRLTSDPSASPSASIQPADEPPGVAFPQTAAGLPVRTISAAVADELHGRVAGLVAIRGYLVNVGPMGGCPSLAFGTGDLYCQRELRLSEVPEPGSIDPVLHPTAMPGVVVPPAAASGPQTHPAGESGPIPAVVVGIFGETRAGGCFVEGKPCGPSFVVESVAWANGRTRRPGPQLGPGVTRDEVSLDSRDRRAIRMRNLPGAGAPLFDAALRPTTLATVDPQAAAALGSEPPNVIWYVRLASSPRQDSGRDVAWLIIDDGSGRILAGWDPTSGYAWPG